MSKLSSGSPLVEAEGEAGKAVYSMEEMTLIWRERSLPAPMPRVDFSKQMLVLVFGPAHIESVGAVQGGILVRYRMPASPPDPKQRYRVLPRSEQAVRFEKVP